MGKYHFNEAKERMNGLVGKESCAHPYLVEQK